MSRRQVRNVNIIAYTATIRCWVIVAKNLYSGPLTQCGPDHSGNQVSFRVMVFADLAVRIGTGGIKVSKRNGLHDSGPTFLIEKIFNIDGFGLLGFESLVERDYPIVMGILVISSLLFLIGNILSDICVALVDPRVKFGSGGASA